MNELNIEVYKDANFLNGMACFQWDILQDKLFYDEQMKKILKRDLPRENVRENMLNARIVHPKDRVEFRSHIDNILNVLNKRKDNFQDFSLDFKIYATQKFYTHIHMSCRVHYETNGKPLRVTGFLQNITQTYLEHNKMKNLAERDAMTGLYSKMHTQYLVNQIASEGMHALIVLDMDNFKQVNDRLGHLIGDAVILDVALSLQKVFRKSDILGHIGGDEFLVLMKDVDEVKIINDKCLELRKILKRSYTQGDETVEVSASLGIALSPEHGQNYKTLFEHADAALYEVKRRGKNNHLIYSADFKKTRGVQKGEESKNAQDYNKLVENPQRYILSMIFNAKDTALTVKILMDIFAKHFNVNRAYVLWHTEEGIFWPQFLFDCVVGNFENAESTHNPEVRRRMRKKYQTTDIGRFTECKDTQNLTSEKSRAIFKRAEIRSYLECAIMDGEIFLGCVGFDDCQNPRTWTKTEYEVLQAFANVMRRFLFGQLYYEHKKNSGNLWD